MNPSDKYRASIHEFPPSHNSGYLFGSKELYFSWVHRKDITNISLNDYFSEYEGSPT